MNRKTILQMVFALAFSPLYLGAARTVDPDHPVIGTWLGDFTISTSQDPPSSKYDSWKELDRYHADGLYESTFHLYKNGKIVSVIEARGRWGADDHRTFWAQCESVIQDGVRHSSSDRSQYTIEELADGVLTYASTTLGRKFQSKRVKDDFKLPLAVTALRGVAADPKPMPVKEALERHLLLYAIRPEYPFDMEHHAVTGKGTFELRFHYETGHLREIHMVKSTGSPMLDRSAIDSLKHWKAKPRALNAVLVPVDFTGTRAGSHAFP